MSIFTLGAPFTLQASGLGAAKIAILICTYNDESFQADRRRSLIANFLSLIFRANNATVFLRGRIRATTVVTTHRSDTHHASAFLPILPMRSLEASRQIRDWLYVKDHCNAVRRVQEPAVEGEVYKVGGWSVMLGLGIVHTVCTLRDELRSCSVDEPCNNSTTYLTDLPGRDRCFAIDTRKRKREVGCKPLESFESGIGKIQYRLSTILCGAYRERIKKNYAGRTA